MFELKALRRFYILALLLFFVVAFGTVGYKVISGWQESWLNCLYMTIITLTTVGFGEIIDLAHLPHGRAFTLLILFMGMGVITYFVSTMTSLIVEGDLNHFIRRRKLMKTIGELENHYICCGCGDTGLYVANELLETGRDVVVIEKEPNAVETLLKKHPRKYIPIVDGDAIESAVLVSAGLERAAGLASCLGEDKDNLIVVYTAREIDKECLANGKRVKPLRIIAMARNLDNIERIKKAGANSVISPNFIGGLRIVSEMVRPTVVTFLDKMLRDKDRNLRVEELTVPEDSSWIGKTIEELNPKKIGNLLLLAILRPYSDEWIYNPSADTKLEKGITLVFMGSPEGRKKLEEEIKG
ncbi:MAG: potassium channel protein [Myxococcota bacterium]